MMIELRRLRHLLAVVEHGNFSRAADAVHLTQPALSRSIQSLEAEVGAALLQRGRGAIEPTELGRLMVRHAATLLANAQDLDRDLRLARGMDLGELRIGVGPFGGSALIGPVVGQLSREHPRLQVKLVVAPWQELPQRARAREVDLVVAELSEIRLLRDFEFRALSAHPSHFVCRAGHPLTALAAPTAQDVFAYPLAAPSLPTQVADRVLAAMPAPLRERVQRDGPVTIECDSYAVLLRVLMASDAISNMPGFMFAHERRAGLLTVLSGVDIGLHAQFGAAWLGRRALGGAATRLVELLVAHDATIGPESGSG